MQGEHVDDLDIEFVVAAPVVIPNLQAVYFCNKERQVHRF